MLMLGLESDPPRLARCLDQLCNTADVSELAAFYRGLPLYPEQPRYVARATEGSAHQHEGRVRSDRASQPVSERAVSRTGLEPDGAQGAVRGQPAVADRWARSPRAIPSWRACCATTRTSAGRQDGPVSPELWRCVGPHATGTMLQDLERVLKKGTEQERAAAALALHASSRAGCRRSCWNAIRPGESARARRSELGAARARRLTTDQSTAWR